MFDPEFQQGGGAAGYGHVMPLVPGTVDPVRLAAMVEAIDAGALVWDPVEEALCGPEPGVDAAALFARLDDAEPDDANGALVPADPPVSDDSEVADPRVLVPEHLPGVEGMTPGPELASLLDGAQVSALGAYEVVETVAGWQRLASWAAAKQADAIMELSRRAEMQPTQNGGRRIESMSSLRVAATEVAARLALTPSQGEALAARALVWCQDLPATRAALEAGRIDVRRAEVIADTLRGHTLSLARAVEVEVLPAAETMTAPRLRLAIIAVLHRLDPTTMADRAAKATDNRFVRVIPAKDGMAWLEAYLPAEDATAIQSAVQAAAEAMKRSDPDDGRSMDQRRADALAQLGWLALATGRLGGCPCGQRLDATHRRPVTVQVTVPIGVLLGLDDSTPAELAGHGPIPAEVARRLAAHGIWRRLLTDPASGTLLDYGRTRYAPPPDLVEHVHARDQRCRFPGCERPAPACDTDHTVPYPAGPTAAGNLGPLCGSHHIGKHHTRWKVRQPAPGRFEWVSPTGQHTYPVESADPDPPVPAAPLQAADIPPF
jgi:hypothetical protein